MAFPTPLLDARLAREKTQNEQDRQKLLQMTVNWLQTNAARYGFKQGYVFGSVTERVGEASLKENRFTQYSDIDLAVETHKIGDVCALMGGLSMVVMRDIDMVPLDQCHFAEKIRRVGLIWIATELPQ